MEGLTHRCEAPLLFQKMVVASIVHVNFMRLLDGIRPIKNMQGQ